MPTRNESMLATVLRHLAETKGDWPAVARECGIPYQTLTKIALRIHRDPRVSTVQTLFDYFVEHTQQPVSEAAAH